MIEFQPAISVAKFSEASFRAKHLLLLPKPDECVTAFPQTIQEGNHRGVIPQMGIFGPAFRHQAAGSFWPIDQQGSGPGIEEDIFKDIRLILSEQILKKFRRRCIPAAHVPAPVHNIGWNIQCIGNLAQGIALGLIAIHLSGLRIAPLGQSEKMFPFGRGEVQGARDPVKRDR